jgi:hypothetical protein
MVTLVRCRSSGACSYLHKYTWVAHCSVAHTNTVPSFAADAAEMMAIHGVGTVSFRKFGGRFLSVIEAFLKEKGITPVGPFPLQVTADAAAVPPKSSVECDSSGTNRTVVCASEREFESKGGDTRWDERIVTHPPRLCEMCTTKCYVVLCFPVLRLPVPYFQCAELSV